MRKIYASPRVENVERLVAVMAEHGIATKITNRRVYDSRSHARFSYARPGHSENWPTVWVAHANDHSRARQLLRDIGIEPSIRYAEDLAAYRAQQARGRNTPGAVANRVRIALLIGVAIAMAVYAARLHVLG